MRRKRPIQKVTAFVTRMAAGKAELLLMEHPTAGIQLPAGTVELGETPEAAVFREVKEETGLVDVELVEILGQLSIELPESEKIVTRVTKLFDAPASDASSVGGFGLSRGSPVKVKRVVDGFAEVICDPLDLGEWPPIRVNGVEGFVRTSLLTGTAERYLFHLVITKPAPDYLKSFTDGVTFRCYWESLNPMPELHPDQQSWLEQSYMSLLASVERRNSQ